MSKSLRTLAEHQQCYLRSILIDERYAVMTREAFEQLKEYSSTIPSGVYPGKMWRRHDGLFDANRTQPPRWLFCWYGSLADSKKVSINFREVLLV